MATTTTTSPAAWSPDVTGFLPGDAVPDAIILACSTIAGTVEGDEPAVRIPFVADDGDAGFVAEGAVIDESDPDLDETVVLTSKVAKLSKFSAEQLEQPNAAKLIVDSMSRSVTRRGNAAFLGNPSAGPGPAGLLNAGIAEIVTPIGSNLDQVTDAIALIETADGTATHIIASPTAWADLSKLKKATDSNESLLGAGTETTERRLESLPVLVTNAMPAGDLLVLDSSTILSAVGDVKLARSEHAYFASDSVGVRVTWRFGWKVQRPGRVVKLHIA